MRLGYLTYGLDREPTGIGRYALELLRALAQRGDAPEIVVLSTEQTDKHNLWQQFEHHKLPGCRTLPMLMSAGQVALSYAIEHYDLDIVHDPNGIAPFLGPGGSSRRITTVHDAFAYVYPQVHNWLDNQRFRWQLPYAARRADAVITVSDTSRRDLVHHLGLAEERVHVTTEGVDRRFKPIEDGPARQAVLRRYGIEAPFMLYVGSINPRKNIARLFEACALVHELLPDYRLVIGGKRQWQAAEIDEQFRQLDAQRYVHFTGYVDDADLPALYSAAEVFVFPSLYEGFGLPPIEAMACGTPVVTSNVSSLPEVVGDAAIVVDPYDVKALAAGIILVLTEHSARAELRRRGLARASRFTWQQAAEETFAVYERAREQPYG